MTDSLSIQSRTISPEKNQNCEFTFAQVLRLLVLFPFFSVWNNAFSYEGSAPGKLFSCRKDIFCRFMNDGRIDWRRLVYCFHCQMIGIVSWSSSAENDTDLPQWRFKAKGLGKLLFLIAMKCILGFKAMFLCYSDRKSQFMIDSTIQAESGMNPDELQGLSSSRKAVQYTWSCGEDEKVCVCNADMFRSKVSNAITMLPHSISEGVWFDYLLVDSWFPCSELLHFIKSCHFKSNFLGMIKMGRTRYKTAVMKISVPEIIRNLVRFKMIKHACSIGYHYTRTNAVYDSVGMQLFFYQRGYGGWNTFIFTDLNMDLKEAFRFYYRRWVIEVAHKEKKQLLYLCKCQKIDFVRQIAGLSLRMIQYKISSCVNRLESYETIGGLFAEVTGETVKLSLMERICGLIIEFVNVIVEFIACDPFELIQNVINNNGRIKAVGQAFDRLKFAR
ncbi:MAG: IS4 family transposase [Candidatus Cryptobacteroides sp.]